MTFLSDGRNKIPSRRHKPEMLHIELTCNLLSSTVSVVLFPPGLAAFQNCFWAEYLFIGHNLNRQSERKNRKHTKNTLREVHTNIYTCLQEPLHRAYMNQSCCYYSTIICVYTHSPISKARVSLYQHQTINVLFLLYVLL